MEVGKYDTNNDDFSTMSDTTTKNKYGNNADIEEVDDGRKSIEDGSEISVLLTYKHKLEFATSLNTQIASMDEDYDGVFLLCLLQTQIRSAEMKLTLRKWRMVEKSRRMEEKLPHQ